MVHLVLLSGGSGTRLWPLSNDARSKQFLKVLRDSDGNHISMVQRVFSQINGLDAEFDITIATCDSQRNSIERQVDGAYSLVLEPERRDTAPAIMLACAHLSYEQKVDPGETVIVMPIDTYAEQDYYERIADLDAAVQGDEADLVLLGVEPTYPSAKYGYIVPSSKEGPVWPVKRFAEKPEEGTTAELIAAGGLWNCGVFAFKLGTLSSITEDYCRATTFEDVLSFYSDLPKNSFDYEVVEKATSIAVLPYTGAWKDLGTWNTLCEEMADASAGRVVMDKPTCENTHVVNETGLPLVVSGIRDAVIVATPDGLLVCSKERSAHLKPLVKEAAASRPMYERRRWGTYRVLDSSAYQDGTRSLVKELVIEPGRQLSYQRHVRRSEVWTVVSGEGEVVLNGEASAVGPGSVVSVGPGCMHAARAFKEMRVVEVQMGDVLVEEDIERFGNYWDSEREGVE